jgi:DNA polymerase I-like protein with 3'-5' exonuclease and polymerase domains
MLKHHWPSVEELRDLASQHNEPFIFDTETDGLEVINGTHKAWIVGLMPAGVGAALFIDCRDPRWPEFKSVLEGMDLVAYNGRFDSHALRLNPKRPIREAMAGVYHRSLSRRKSLDNLGAVHGMPKIPTLPELKGKKREANRIQDLTTGVGVWRKDLLDYLADDLVATYRVWRRYGDRPQDSELELCVANMERRGARLLPGRLQGLRAELEPIRDAALRVIVNEGFTGNLNSWQQLLPWLQGRHPELTGTNSKGDISPMFDRTGDHVLEALLDYRKYNKLVRDFCDTLPGFAQDGIIYGSIKTMHTKTKRFSHADPNMAQIPKQGRTDRDAALAVKFRECITGRSGVCSGADYSQVELRVMAALACDVTMLRAFQEGADPHAATAAVMFDTTAVSKRQRTSAKAINFGILFGMGLRLLAQTLKCSRVEAKRFLRLHQQAHPEVHEYIGWVKEEADRCGYAEGLDGSLLITDNPNSAVSLRVQGGAALLMREALVACEHEGLRPFLSVHDELICDVREQGELVAKTMQDAANSYRPDLFEGVDFVAEGGHGETWAAV